MAYRPPGWPREFDGGEGLGEGQFAAAQDTFMMDGILQENDVPGSWRSSQGTQRKGGSPAFNNMSDHLVPDMQGNKRAVLDFNKGHSYAIHPTSSPWNRFGSGGKWNSTPRCVAGTMDDSGSPNICVCDSCWEACQQDAFSGNSMLTSLPREMPRSAMPQQSSYGKHPGHYHQSTPVESEDFYPDDNMMLDQPGQMETQLSSSPSSSDLPWMVSQGNGPNRQEKTNFPTSGRKRSIRNDVSLPREQEDTRVRNNVGHVHQSGSGDHTNSLNQGFSSPAKSLEDAYLRLEINCVYLPYPNDLQKHALSIISGLSLECVQAFYARKHGGASNSEADVTQSQETQSLLGIQTVNKEDINFSDSAYYSHSSSGSSGAQNRHNAYELDSAAFSPDEQPSKSIKRKAALRHGACDLEETPKIFECTWRGCQERFRSKRDWRRHEESIHCQQFTWKCPVEVTPNRRNHGKTVCGREFKRDDKFREHLRNAKGGHGYDDVEIGTMVEDVRQPLFPASPFRNECGFCGEFLPTWECRIDHIADEYTKKGKNMSMWKDPWPRRSSSGSKPDDDDEGGDDDDDDNDDGSNRYGPRISAVDRNASSRTEPKYGHSGGSSQRRGQANDRHAAGGRGSHKFAGFEGKLLNDGPHPYRIKKEPNTDSDMRPPSSTATSSDDEAIFHGMARRRRSAVENLTVKRCCEPNCNKEFRRPCDLTKHTKIHLRPWKCSESSCKYNEYGWPTEKELDRHTNDKHSSSPALYKCQFAPCLYQSKRESNCNQHMQKSHGWSYVRSKKTDYGEFGDSSPRVDTLQHPQKKIIVGSVDMMNISITTKINKPSKEISTLPRVTETILDDVVDGHKRRVALKLADIDRGLSGLDVNAGSASKDHRSRSSPERRFSTLCDENSSQSSPLSSREVLPGVSSHHGYEFGGKDFEVHHDLEYNDLHRYRRRRGEGTRSGLRRKKRRSATSAADGRPRPPWQHNHCGQRDASNGVTEPAQVDELGADGDDEGANSDFEYGFGEV